MTNTTLIRTIVLLAGIVGLQSTHAQTYRYDAAGRLVAVAYPEGGGVGYSYDMSDNMTAGMPLTLPAQPMGVEVSRVSNTSAKVSWAPDPAAGGYIVERRVVGSNRWEQVGTVGGSATMFVDGTLQPGVEYEYRVSASSTDGASVPSGPAGFTGLPAPNISQSGVVNGASFEQGEPIAPGSIISVFGDNIGAKAVDGALAPFQALAISVPLPTSLNGATLMIDGREAPLFFIGGVETAASIADTQISQSVISGQVNAQVPWETALGNVNVVFSQQNTTETTVSESEAVSVALVSPSLFTFEFGGGRVVGLNVKVNESDGVINGSIAQPEGAFPGVASQPAALGGVVTLFANALGPVEPAAITGQDSIDALRSVTTPLRVFVGDAEAQVLFAGLAPQFVALYQLNIIVPLGAVPGDAVPIRIEQGGLVSRADVTIAIRQ